MKRLIFLDFLRGFSIIYMILVHAISNAVFEGQTGAINTVNPIFVWAMFPFVLLGTWAPFFSFISGTANVYVMYNIMAKNPTNQELKKAVIGIMINSFFVLVLSFMNMSFFHHSFDFNGSTQYTLLSGWIERGEIVFYPDLLFYTDAMHIIAVSGFVLCLILFFLWRNGGFEKKRRNISILAGIAFIVVIISPVMVKFLEPIYYSELNAEHYFNALLLKSIVGPRQSSFPNIANALIGALFGIEIAQNTRKEDIKEFGLGFGLLFLAIDLFLLIPENPFQPADFTRHDLPVTIYMLNMGLQALLFTFLILKMEYPDKKSREKIAKRTTGVRRFGLIALTIYIFEGMVSVFLGKLFLLFWGPDFVLAKNIGAIVLFLIIDIGLWYIVLKIWEKWDFKYSIEWWLVYVVGKLRGRKSSRLHIREVLYNPGNIPSEESESNFEPLFPAEPLQKTNLDKIIE